MEKQICKKGIFCLCAAGAFLYGAVQFGRQKAVKQKLDCCMQNEGRYMDNFFLLSHWMEAKNNGKCTADYFREKGYRDIAIYGMGELANRLCEELQGTDVQVRYGIDREPCGTVSRMDRIYTPDSELENVDAVIVTPFYAMEDICGVLNRKVNCPIISLEEVVWSL